MSDIRKLLLRESGKLSVRKAFDTSYKNNLVHIYHNRFSWRIEVRLGSCRYMQRPYGYPEPDRPAYTQPYSSQAHKGIFSADKGLERTYLVILYETM